MPTLGKRISRGRATHSSGARIWLEYDDSTYDRGNKLGEIPSEPGEVIGYAELVTEREREGSKKILCYEVHVISVIERLINKYDFLRWCL